MASQFVDQDQKWLMDCLTATLDTNREVRSFAETSLHQASLQPGFGTALTKVTVNMEVPFGLRQLSAVLLKQFIKQHWQEGEENFIHPAASTDEKGVIRQLLLPSLDDSSGKIRTAIGMVVASIAQYDWPEDWPELLPSLLKLISDQSNKDGVRGALRCLALLSDDLDDTLVPKLVPNLFPYLHTVISSPHLYEKSLRSKALSIVHSCVSILGSMSGVYKTETIALMMPMVSSLMEHFSTILQPPMQSGDPDDWSIRMEVLKCLLQFIQNFPSLVQAQFSVIMAPLWHTFVSTLEVYQLSSIQGCEDAYLGRFDSDGGEKSLDTFVIQLFEFLLTIVGNSRMAKVIGSSIRELVYYIIAFLQMTEEQVHTWSLDANQYVADEDDVTYSCRVSGSLLLEEIANTYREEGINSIIEGAQKRFSESCHAKVAGSTDWWRLREASLFALVSLSEQLLEAQDSGLVKIKLGALLDKMITEDMGTGLHEYPFLHARAFSAVSKFSHVISRGISEQFLCAAIQAIALDVPPPVKVGACRALSQLLSEANKEVVQPHIMGLFSALTGLLKQASDETLHLVLETLQAAVRAGHELSQSIEPILSPVILNVWAQHVSDPFISIDAVEVLEAIKNAPGCIRPLVSRILPSVGAILDKPQLQPAGLVAGSLDLMTMILKSAPADVVKAVFDVCFNPVIQVILESDDHGEMQNATECLAAFLSGGKQDFLAWGGNPEHTMKRLLDAVSRLLDPNLESSGSLFVGSYILQLILHLPSQMAPHIRELVTAVVRRMQSSEIAVLKSSLIVVFARLVHLSSPDIDQFINMLLTVPVEGHANSFYYVMSEWTKLQGEIQGAYQIKVTTTALALLLSTRHVEMAKVNVQGHLMKSNSGITTRSKARLAPEQWTVVPLPKKIFSLLAEALLEIQEQALDGDEEDSDWEEISESEGGIPQDILYSSSVPSNANPSVEHLDAMAKAFNESDDESYEDELTKLDPLNEIKLADFLRNFFIGLSNTDRSLFDHLFQSLTHAQRSAVAKVLS
ncbi:importin-9 isoform X2 [Asparagus officinalis]|uniref:importin-9 isoform X2 n=1 Tax=Asparagus officinalis TaxID=4686 RepID=UPI00098E14FD|nr:importin-9 isoform X2 [Asparagus officinalis]